MSSAQPGASIQANIRGGGGDGKCTFEVVVDGVAEVEIRGTRGYLRTLSGAPARWTRLDCNQPFPLNPSGFQFKGIDGRGSQNLVADPNSNRGAAVIRLEDPQGGSEGYTGDITWTGGSGSGYDSRGYDPGYGNRNGAYDRGGYNRGGAYGGYQRRGGRVNQGDALNICRDEVMSRRNVSANEVTVRPGGMGSNGEYNVDFYFQGNRRERSGYCSVSQDGRISDFQIGNGGNGVFNRGNSPFGRGRMSLAQATDICRDEVGRRYNTSTADVRVRRSEGNDRGGYFVDFDVNPRGGGRRSGTCTVRGDGTIEDIR